MVYNFRLDATPVQDICYQLGHYFQAQDDFLDIYGDPTLTGKAVGGDVLEGKCAWPIVKALQMADNETRLTLNKNYGQNSPESIEMCKAVFDRLDIPGEYEKFETEERKAITESLENISSLPLLPLRTVFLKHLDFVYRRKKWPFDLVSYRFSQTLFHLF